MAKDLLFLPGGPVTRQDRAWGAWGSLRAEVPFRGGVCSDTEPPRSAAPCGGVPAMGQIRQAGRAGVFCAVTY